MILPEIASFPLCPEVEVIDNNRAESGNAVNFLGMPRLKNISP